MKLDNEMKNLFNNVRIKLGAPIRKIQLDDDMLYSLFTMCVEDYAKIVQNWIAENNWSTLFGKDLSTTDIAWALSTRTFDIMKDYSYYFSKEVGLQQRGPWELKKDFITIEAGKQSYLIPDSQQKEIVRVMWHTPSTTQMANLGMAGMAGGMGFGGGMGAFQLGGGMGGGTNYAGGYMYSAYDNLLIAADLREKQKMIKSDLQYTVNAGPNGTKIINLLSVPGGNVNFGSYQINDHGAAAGYSVVGSTIWYTYYETKTKKDGQKCRNQNPDVILSPDMVPLDKMEYTNLNLSAQTTIRQLLVAESKILLGNIRGTFSGSLGIQEANAVLEYAIFLEQGKEEKAAVITELTDRLTRMSPLNQSEIAKTISNNKFELGKMTPPKGWLVV
jgi:hypothetical protein